MSQKHCLKCGTDSEVPDLLMAECPKCGAIYIRVEEAHARKATEDAEREANRLAQQERIAIADKAAAERNRALIATFTVGKKPAIEAKQDQSQATLIDCPTCKKSISSSASACPSCGHPLLQMIRFEGPPKCCSNCGGALKKEAKATNSGSGCLIVLVGLLFTPLLLGIPVLLYGLHLMWKREGQWRCIKCHALFPRKIGWFEFS